MGKQYRKLIKRSRRKALLKRKKQASKTGITLKIPKKKAAEKAEPAPKAKKAVKKVAKKVAKKAAKKVAKKAAAKKEEG